MVSKLTLAVFTGTCVAVAQAYWSVRAIYVIEKLPYVSGPGLVEADVIGRPA